jgi:hypothetical protein
MNSWELQATLGLPSRFDLGIRGGGLISSHRACPLVNIGMWCRLAFLYLDLAADLLK